MVAVLYAQEIDRIADETEALVRATLRRGIAATAQLADQVLELVRGMVILESVGPTLEGIAADPPRDAALLSALVAGMITGDLLGRAQVVREVESQGFDLTKPLESAFADSGLGSRFAALGSLEFEPLDPVEAIALFRDKVPMTSQAFSQLTEAYRARAFTIAGQETARAVAVVQGWLDQVLARGLTMRDFLAGLQEAADAGGITAVNPYHAETVFRTNVQTAYNAGRWEMYHAPEVAEAFPYFQYHTVGDDRVRPAHAAMDGFIARRDDPVWEEWWPPNGFNCAKAGTLVITALGLIPIEDVRYGDVVLTHRRRWCQVIELHRNYFVGNLVRLTLEDGRQVDVTPNHEFFTEFGWIPAAALDRIDELPDFLPARVATSARTVISGHPAHREIEHRHSLPFNVLMPPPARRAGRLEELDPDIRGRKVEADPVGMNRVVEEDLESAPVDHAEERPFSPSHGSPGVRMLHRLLAIKRDMGEGILVPNIGMPRAGGPPQLSGRAGDTGMRAFRQSGCPMPIRAGRTVSSVGPTSVDIHNPTAHGERLATPSLRVVDPLRGHSIGTVPDGYSVEAEQSRDRSMGVDSQPRADLSTAEEISEVRPAKPSLQGFAEFLLEPSYQSCTLQLHGESILKPGRPVKIKSISHVWHEGIVYNLGVEYDSSYCMEGLPVHNCRCTVTAISIEETEAKGIQPSRRAVPQPDPGFAGNAAKDIRAV